MDDNTIIIELTEYFTEDEVDFILTHMEGIPIEDIPRNKDAGSSSDEISETTDEMVFEESIIEKNLRRRKY
ncbi:MAG: hypothetical protein AB8G05_00385 [Oligoflexales bacterium]